MLLGVPRPRLPGWTARIGALCCVCLPAIAAADSPPSLVVGAETPGVIDLVPHVAVLVDPDASLGIGDVIAAPWSDRFTATGGLPPTHGFTTAAVWLRAEIRSTSNLPQEWLVELSTARLSHFTWFVVHDGRVELVQEDGAVDRQAQAAATSRFPLLRLPLPPGGSRVVYGRARSDTSIRLPLTVATPPAYARHDVIRTARDMAQFGFCAAIAFQSLLLGGLQRRPLDRRLMVIALAYMAYASIYNGYLPVFWPGRPLWLEKQGLMAAAGIGTFGFIGFNLAAIGAERVTVLDRGIARTATAILVLALGSLLLFPFAIAAQIMLTAMIVALLASLAVVVRSFDGWRLDYAMVLLPGAITTVYITIMRLEALHVVPPLVSEQRLGQFALPVMLTGFSLAISSRQKNLLEAEMRLAAAREAESAARLEALRFQINPHFLFNTLTAIDALSRVAPGRIPAIVERLATFLRLRVLPTRAALVPLDHEIATVRAYLDIEQVRYGDALAATYDIAPGIGDCPVPVFMLQLIVENAVKHSRETDDDLRLQIGAHAVGERIVISVANPGLLVAAGLPADTIAAGLGLGTKNIRERLALHYGPNARFSLVQEGDLVVARLDLPRPRDGV